MSKTEIRNTKSINEIKADLDPSPEIRSYKDKVQHLNSRMAALKIELGQKAEFFTDLLGAIQVIKPSAMQYSPSLTKIESPVSCVLLMSDWHIGAVIERDVIEGFNDYSWEIAQERILGNAQEGKVGLAEKLIKWVGLNRSVYTVNELVIVAVGDLISGDIHDELKVTNEFPAPMQIANAATLLSRMISAFAPHFQSIRVEFVVPDNHSRLTKKPQCKQAGENSYNYLVGYIAKEQLREHKNVNFNLIMGVKEIIRVQGMRYLALHGDGIKGWSGIPYYGIERHTAREAIGRMRRSTKTHFDKILMGHFHSPVKQAKFTIGGSLSGTDEFDHKCGREADPCQSAWFVHAKHGEFNYTEFWGNQ